MRLNRKTGMIDGTLFLVFWSIVGMASSTYWYGALPIIIFIVTPASAFVAWRGAKSVNKIKSGETTNKLSAMEGAVCGFIASLVLSLWSYSTQVYAAGNFFDDVSPNTIEWYLRLVEVYTPIITAGTVVGSVHGVLFFNINKYLLREFREQDTYFKQ